MASSPPPTPPPENSSGDQSRHELSDDPQPSPQRPTQNPSSSPQKSSKNRRNDDPIEKSPEKQGEDDEESEHDESGDALRLKSLAEQKLKASSLKSALKYAKRAARIVPDLEGIAQMVTALKILSCDSSDHYKVLRLPPFSAPSTIRKQYKALALALHPDKSSSSNGAPIPAAEDAFKRVADSFRFLSDRYRKQDFDLRLRLLLASDAARKGANFGADDTFWTACSTCRLLHEFDRKYVGYRLVCPSCKKSFLAVEVSPDGKKQDAAENGENVRVVPVVTRSRSGSRPRNPMVGSVVEEEKRTPRVSSSQQKSVHRPSLVEKEKRRPAVSSGSHSRVTRSQSALDGKKRKAEVLSSSVPKKAQVGRERTLAEIQMELAKAREKTKEKQNEKVRGKDKEVDTTPKENGRRSNVKEKSLGDLLIKEEQVNLMAVEDSDFYEFDNDRTEKSLRKGQVWALYDDDDGMPRHYGIIEEVISSHPFRIKMNWLDIQTQGNEELIHWENSGYHISCGRFKIGKTVDIKCVNFFSHLVNCERATRDIYRIYPKKGSVWALYGEQSLGVERGRHYDIIVSLTSYSETYGLSIAHLEKVKGFKTVFRRKAIGCHAIKWLEKDDFRLFSHEIPAQKLSETRKLDLPGDCWELDPASLPPELLTIGWN